MNEIEKALSGLKRLELTLGDSIFRSQDGLAISFLNKELEAVCIAQKVLREKQERSEGCPCCSGMTFLSGYFCGSGRADDNHVIAVDTEDTADFNFCPMCGRKLREG